MTSLLNNPSVSPENKFSLPDSLYHELFNLNDIVKLIIDPDTLQIVDANLAACHFYGYPQAQIQSLRLTEINTLPEVQVRTHVQTVMAGTNRIYETRHRMASVEIRDVEVHDGVIKQFGKSYVYAIIQDVTQRKQMEIALRKSEQLYRLFAQNMPDAGVIMFDIDLRYTLVEGPFLRRFGSLYEGIVGKLAQEALPTQDAIEFVIPVMQRALRGESFSYERQMPDYAYEARVSPLLDENGQIIGGMILSHDISERNRLENELRASEERLRLITSNIQDLVIQCDAQDRILYVGPSCLPLLGYKPEEMMGHFAYEFVPPDALDKIVPALRQITQQGLTNGIIEARMRHADGYYVDVETTGSFLYDRDANYTGGIFVARDISERKQFEAALIESEEKYRLITQNISDGIFVFDAVAQRPIYISPSYDRLLGREEGETLTLPIMSFSDAVHPEDSEQMLAQFTGAITNKVDNLTISYRSRRKSGQDFWREDHSKFTYDPYGSLLRIDVVSRDISERKQIENMLVEQQKLRISLEKEQELSSLKSHMMERIAHEFRTPLTTIQVATETLGHYYDRLTDEKRLEKRATVKNQIRRITQMLDEISLVITGADTLAHLERVPTNLEILCQEIATELSTALKLPNKYLIEVQGEPLASLDSMVIRDCLTHIMRNAARYSEPADPVTIRIAQIGDSVELRVIDHGIGIPADELPRIFEPFFRGSNIDERGGLGIGLTIARAAIEAHGGTIRVESEVGKGTTFVITLSV